METKTSIGQAVDSYCGKCRQDRPHIVAVTDDEAIAKVRCTVCASLHKPRKAPGTGKSRALRVKEAPVSEATAQLNWEACIAAATGGEHPYSMTARYRLGDIVNHFAFGKGVVVRLYPSRCDMLFKDKRRLMVSANK